MKQWRVSLAVAVAAVGLWSAPTTNAAPVTPVGVITDPKLQAEIAQATAQAQRIETTGARTAAPTVSIEVLTTDVDSTKRLVRAYGGTITGDVPGALVQAEVPPTAAGLIAAGRTVDALRSPLRSGRLPVTQTIARQTIARPRPELGTGYSTGTSPLYRTNAQAWQTFGYTGDGAKVGIVDYFDFDYWLVAELGAMPDAAHVFCRDSVAPSGPNSLCASPTSFATGTDFTHGLAVAEIVKDVAPGADLYFASVATVSDLRAAIDWFAANGVPIISRSLGSAYDGPGDGTGALASLVDYAVGKGITWFNSAGNDAYGAYTKRTVAATDASGYVNFAGSGSDTWLRVDSSPGSCFYVDGVRWANDWYLPAAQRTDYRLEVYQPAPGFVPGAIGTTRNPTASQVKPINLNVSFPQGGQGPGGNVVDASQRAGAVPLEAADLEVCPTNNANRLNSTPTAVTYLRVKRNLTTAIGSPADRMEVAIAGDAYLEQWVSNGSAAKPVVDSKNPGLVSVGAQEDFSMWQATDDPGGGIAYYSSRGPTTDGRTKPDITTISGDNSETFAHYAVVNGIEPFDPSFHGTSAAAPGVAGVAALIMAENLSRPGQPLAAMIRNVAWDLGPPGLDNFYGAGSLLLSGYPYPYTWWGGVEPAWYGALDSPVRVLNTRGGIGGYSGAQRPHSIVTVDLPPELSDRVVGAVALNVTLVGPQQPGYVQAYPYMDAVNGATSTLNVSSAGGVRPNFVIVPVGPYRKVSIYMPTGGDLIVDVMGAFTPSFGPHGSGRFQPLVAPERWVGGRTLTSQVESVVAPPETTAMSADLAAGLVDSLIVNITAQGASRAGDIKAYETGRLPGIHSNVNFGVSAPSTNLAIVPVDALGQFTLKSNNVAGNTVDVSVDVVGYMTSAAAPASQEGLFVPVTPTRVYREYDPTDDAIRSISISGIAPGEVLALSANLTTTRAVATGYVTMFDPGLARPGTYNLTFSPGQTVANGAIFGAGWNPVTSTNTTSAYLSRGADFIIDVNGYFLAAAPG